MTATVTKLNPTTSKVLAATPKNGNSSVQAIAKKAGVEVLVARKHIEALTLCGLVEQSGTIETGKRGRPAHKFTRVVAENEAA